MKNCGWIRTEKKFVTSCGRVAVLHRGYVYCPYCGKFIKTETAIERCERRLIEELGKGLSK